MQAEQWGLDCIHQERLAGKLESSSAAATRQVPARALWVDRALLLSERGITSIVLRRRALCAGASGYRRIAQPVVSQRCGGQGHEALSTSPARWNMATVESPPSSPSASKGSADAPGAWHGSGDRRQRDTTCADARAWPTAMPMPGAESPPHSGACASPSSSSRAIRRACMHASMMSAW